MDFQLNLAIETVAQARPEEPLIVAPTTSLRDVLQLMQARNRGSVMVCSSSGSLEGILTERDVVRLLADAVDLSIPIERVMVRNPVTLDARRTRSARRFHEWPGVAIAACPWWTKRGIRSVCWGCPAF